MFLARILFLISALTICTASTAQISGPGSTKPLSPRIGRVTELPLPRFVSLKAEKANVRRGPGLTYRIDWLLQGRNMPLRITAEYGHWRRVVDRDGAGGWIHYVLLSGIRTVIVNKDGLLLRSTPSGTAPATAKLERNVIARLGDCHDTWCELTADGYTGWTQEAAVWGTGPKTAKQN